MSSETDITQIIRTKLYPPRTTGHLVPRPRLLQHLEERRGRPLTLVSAPAGYGKTTLALNWLDTIDWPSAWVSLDEETDDLLLFLTYLLAAVETMFPDAVAETQALLGAGSLPPLPVLARSLINELDQVERPFILVLDDFDYIHDGAVLDLLSELLAHPPRPLHLVLICRKDPTLDVTRLRARRQVTEIRAQELLFTETETAVFLEQELGTPADDKAVTALVERVEGWVTGMRLVILSLRHRGRADLGLDRLQGTVAYVTEYLAAEVLAGQPQAIQEYLLHTAILDRFCAPLCQAVSVGFTERPNGFEESAVSSSPAGSAQPSLDGQQFLEWLVTANLFVMPLDGEGRWYRYHHLFRKLLLGQLAKRASSEEIAELHARASTWYAQNGYIDEALRHALAAGDTAAATELISQHRHNLLNKEQWHTLGRWMRLFPRQLAEEEPELLVTQAWTLYNRSQYPEMLAVLDRAETLLAGNDAETVAAKHHQAEIDAMRCEYALVGDGDAEQAVALARRALSEIPHDWFNVRGLAYVILGYSYLVLGEPEQGIEIIHDIWKTDSTGSYMFRARLKTALCFLYYSNADIPELGQVATQLLKLGQLGNLAESVAYARYFLGCFHYFRNELDEAERHLAAAGSDRHIAQIWSTVNSACVLALTYQALDRPDQAQDTAGATLTFLEEMENVEFTPQIRALQAELALRQGRPGVAGRWARQFDPYPLPPLITFCIPQVTLLRVLLTRDTTASQKQATDLLASLYDHVLNDKRYMIEVLALQALLADARGDQGGALEKLERAIHLAEPGDLLRIFVDLGPKMAGLLRQLLGQGSAPHFINQILEALGTERQSPGQATEPSQTTGPSKQPPASGGLVESLTNREVDVLTLMAQGMTNKEIAAKLVISPGTVAQHSHRIYQKLEVKNRRLAVVKATKLGLLPRD